MSNSITNLRCCSKCGEWLPATTEYFYKNGKSQSGKQRLTALCKPCEGERQKDVRKRHPETIKASILNWRRNNPDKVQAQKKRHYWKHRDRHLGKHRQYYQANRGKLIKSAKEWVVKHPARAKMNRRASDLNRKARVRQAAGHYTAADLRLQYKSQGGNCWWCGKALNGKYEGDHVIPLSRGGSNYPSNIVLTCLPCNREKGKKLLHEWNGRLL